jgi:hypothetical protein
MTQRRLQDVVEDELAGMVKLVKNNPPAYAINAQVLINQRKELVMEEVRSAQPDDQNAVMDVLSIQCAHLGLFIIRCIAYGHLQLVFDDSMASELPNLYPETN